jgi:hypothetical protein
LDGWTEARVGEFFFGPEFVEELLSMDAEGVVFL